MTFIHNKENKRKVPRGRRTQKLNTKKNSPTGIKLLIKSSPNIFARNKSESASPRFHCFSVALISK